jgi:hypothetical protein
LNEEKTVIVKEIEKANKEKEKINLHIESLKTEIDSFSA